MSKIILATFLLLATAVYTHPANLSTAGEESTAIYIANWTFSDAADFSNLKWIDITSGPSIENRIGDDHCLIVKHVTVKTNSDGKWWSDWCRVGGLETKRKGDQISITSSQQRTTTIHADITITAPMLSSLTATVGVSVSNSVGWSKGYACTNDDGITHGLWFQEHIGWAWQTITEKFSQTGPSWCPRAPATHVHSEQINWPDPEKTGSRHLSYRCDWDNKGGRQCNFWDPKYL